MDKRTAIRIVMTAVCGLFLLACPMLGLPSATRETDETSASLSGFVKDSDSKETLIGATIYLKSTKYNAHTNKSGFYSISNVPPGKYTLIVSYIGYKKHESKIEFKAGQAQRKDIELAVSSISQTGIVIEAERGAEEKQISISKVDVPVSIIKEIRVGGESDVFRTLQLLPGVLTSSQISSGLYVRGGSPDQNLVLLDGSTVYNPSHLFGFISTFNSDAIKDVDLIKGGYPAEYGGRLSSVLNITQKDGSREKMQGVASLGVISSRLSLEGPLGKGSWFIAGRRTYFEIIKSFLPKDPENPIPDFNFYDLNGKFTQDFGSDDKITLSGFLSRDFLDYGSFGTSMNMTVGNRLGAAKWTHIFANNMFSTVNFSASKYYNEFSGDQSGYGFVINNSINDYTLKACLEWFASEKMTCKFGYELSDYRFNYLQNFTGNKDSSIKQGTAEGGTTNLLIRDGNHSVFGQSSYNFTDLFTMQAGLRANYWTLSDKFTLDPRVSFRYQLQENLALKMAWGVFHQNLRLATQPDFSFFDTWLPTDSTIGVSSSSHYILSLETKPAAGLDLNFDVYYKTLSNISELNQNALEGSTVSDIFYTGSANAWGLEVFFQKKFGRLNGWIGYGLGFINAKFDSINNGRSFHPKYDRTHDVKVVAQYVINDRWTIGGTFTFQTGQSYTGASSKLLPRLPGQTSGRVKIVPTQRYGLRLPPSHQLNLNANYSCRIFGLESKLIIDIYNVYNRRDIWFRYYNTLDSQATVEDVRLLPIVPTLSLEMKF